MPGRSLLFIPDITGFTEFVNRNEIEHSQHIISELLESIIDSNTLNLEISEIEGDAVLFYKSQDVPSLREVYEQAKQMFLKFHSHLKLYESQRICQCGACSSASRLSLKFVVHCAEIGFTTIKNNRKPFGPDIVLLHRLLKNNVEHGEYILFTNAYLQERQEQKDLLNEIKFEEGFSEYENVGLVNYEYVALSDLHSEVPDPPKVMLPEKMKDPIAEEFVFNMPILEVYEYLTNFDLKKQWNEGIDEFKYDEERVNRVGTKHICVFEKGTAEIESITNDFGEGNIVYGEKLLKFPLGRDFSFYYILSPMDDRTKVRLEVHYRPLPVIGWLLKPLINMNIRKIMGNFSNSFSKLESIIQVEGSALVNEEG